MWYDGDDDNNEFRCSFGAMKDPRYEENVVTCSSVALSTMETIGPQIKRNKLSLSLKNNCKVGKLPIILIT